MTQIILFTLSGILLYLLADWILQRIELWRGQRFESRSLIFFIIILALAMTLFSLVEHMTTQSDDTPSKLEKK